MANPNKRITIAETGEFKGRVNYYLMLKAAAVFADTGSYTANEIAFAKLVYARDYDEFWCALIITGNATIGGMIDSAVDTTAAFTAIDAEQNDPIEYAVMTEKWTDIANSVVTAQA